MDIARVHQINLFRDTKKYMENRDPFLLPISMVLALMSSFYDTLSRHELLNAVGIEVCRKTIPLRTWCSRLVQ